MLTFVECHHMNGSPKIRALMNADLLVMPERSYIFWIRISSSLLKFTNSDLSLVDKWSIKPSLAEKLVDILAFMADKDQITTESIVSHFGFNPTTAKRYLRQLTEFGYLEAHGGNKNRRYSKHSDGIL